MKSTNNMNTMQTIKTTIVLKTSTIESVEYLENNRVLKVDLVGKIGDGSEIVTLFVDSEHAHLLIGHHGQSEYIGIDVLGLLPVTVLEVIIKFLCHDGTIETNHELEVIADNPRFFLDRQEAFDSNSTLLEAAGIL
jgi:hypothetical protein